MRPNGSIELCQCLLNVGQLTSLPLAGSSLKCQKPTFEVAGHTTLTESARSEFSLINSLSGRRTCCSRFVTQSALFKEFMHWLPISFDPSARMTVESVRRYAYLREAKLRAIIRFPQVECGN